MHTMATSFTGTYDLNIADDSVFSIDLGEGLLVKGYGTEGSLQLGVLWFHGAKLQAGEAAHLAIGCGGNRDAPLGMGVFWAKKNLRSLRTVEILMGILGKKKSGQGVNPVRFFSKSL
jgi:hypothetical protein